jgi:acyl carrier protein
LPLTPNGKVDRKALPDSEPERHRSIYVAPDTLEQKLLATIWLQVLGITKVGTQDNFFDLGGNSIAIIQLHAIIQERLNRTFPLIAMFEYPTIDSFTKYFSTTDQQTYSFTSINRRVEKQLEHKQRLKEHRGSSSTTTPHPKLG